jgi:hypothetical protein
MMTFLAFAIHLLQNLPLLRGEQLRDLLVIALHRCLDLFDAPILDRAHFFESFFEEGNDLFGFLGGEFQPVGHSIENTRLKVFAIHWSASRPWRGRRYLGGLPRADNTPTGHRTGEENQGNI